MQQLAKYKKLLILLILFGISLRSQVVIPELDTPGYESNFMREVYGRSYFFGNLSSWNEQVLYYQDMLRASWEDQVDEAIFEYVNSVTTSDSVNDVDAYKDYVLKELESQKSVALTNWQEAANLDLLNNREQFLTRLTSSQLDESYISRMGMTQYYNQLKSYQEAQRLQSEIQTAAISWSQNFNQNFQQGISDFTTSFAAIENNYQNLINSIDANDQAFQANLNAINEYKSFVKDSIRSVLTNFEEELGKTCNERYGCVYRQANGELNTAGRKLQSLVDQIKPKLNDNSLNPTMELTLFSQQVRDFLIDQQIEADSEFNKYNPWITSLQTNPFTQYALSDNAYDSGYAYSDATKSNLLSSVLYGGFDYWANVSRASSWTGTENDTTNILRLVYALQLDHFNNDSSYTRLSSIVREFLGPDKELTTIHLANAFARDVQESNTAKFLGIPIAYVARSGNEGNMLAGANNFAFLGVPDQTIWSHWAALRCTPIGCIVDHHQMDSVTFAISYSVKDLVIESQANYWKGIDSSMQGQVGKYNTEILPAVQNWEGQVANYDKFYTEWKVQAEIAKEKAQADYEASLASLEAEKQAWIANSQKEYRDGYLQWSELSANAQSGKTVAADVRSEIGTISTSNNYSVVKPAGLSNLVDSFNAKLETIANQGFTFTDQPADSFLNATTRLQAGESNSGSYTLLGAFSQKTVNTTLDIGGKEYSSIIQGTTIGIYQYAQLVSVNDSNKELAFREQEKLLNQNSWNIEYSSIEIGTMVDGQYSGTGLKDEAAINNILKELNNGARYQIALENCQKEARANTDCFSDVVHKGRLAELSSLGYEYKEGKVVRKLDKSEQIRLGTFKDYESLTQAEKEDFGSCYVDPSLCKTTNGKSLLRKDFNYTIDKQTNVATLTRVINNGQIAHRDGDTFTNGTQLETRTFNLAQVKTVMAPKGKDLFDTWGHEDWENFSTQSTEKLTSFYEVGLVAVGRTTQNAVASIRKIESFNEKKFQNTVDGIKNQESMLKELALAYLTGGMAGIQAAIKGKVEDKINSSLAEVFIRATGGTMEDLQRMTDAFSFVRGRVEQNKIKARDNYYSVNDLAGSIERFGVKYASTVSSVYAEMPVIGPIITTATGVSMALTKEALGKKKYEESLNQATARKDRIVEIKANERAMAKSYVDKAIAQGTGLSLELVSQQSTDFLGARDAARVRKANNARWGAIDQAVGVVGGIFKTAFNAYGMKDRDFAAALKDGNRLLYAGNLNTTYAEKAALAGANQFWGMSGPGLSYQTNVLKIGDNKGIVRELGQQALVTEIARIQGWDKDIVNSIVRKEYGKYEQRQTDKKVQADAIRDTAKLAATLLLPGGIAALAGQFASMAGQIGQIAAKIVELYSQSSKLFTAIVRGVVQVVDGTRNGINGVVAGLGNAVLGVMGTSGVFNFGPNMGILSNSALGLGISYDKDRGYGGMIGIGNSTTNASVGFYQHGATSLDASLSVSEFSQLTLSHSGNSTQVGMNVNAGDGDRKGFNLSLNYDIQQGMASGSIGYTMPDESSPFHKMGLNLNFDRYGMTSTAQYDGINLASMGPAGFSMQEIDWAMLNINEAQDRQKFNKDKLYLEDLNKKLSVGDKPYIDITKISDKDIENLADNERAKEKLIASGRESTESLKGLDPKEIASRLDALKEAQYTENTATGAAVATSLAFSLLGLFGYRREGEGGDVAEGEVGTPNFLLDKQLAIEAARNSGSEFFRDPSTGEIFRMVGDGDFIIRKASDDEIYRYENDIKARTADYIEGRDNSEIILVNDTNSRGTGVDSAVNKKSNFGSTKDTLQAKQDIVAKLGEIDPATKNTLSKLETDIRRNENYSKNLSEFGKRISNEKDIVRLIDNPGELDKILKDPFISKEERNFFNGLKLVIERNGILPKNQSDLTDNFLTEGSRETAIKDALKELQPIKESAIKSIALKQKQLTADTNALIATANQKLNEVIIKDNQKYNDDPLSREQRSLELSKTLNNPAQFQAYIDTHVSSRLDIANERIVKNSERAQIEKNLKSATGTEKKVLEGKLTEINKRIETLDENLQSFRLGRKLGEPESDYLKRMSDSFKGEIEGIGKIVKDLEAQIAIEKSKSSPEKAKIDKLNRQIIEFESRLLTAENQLARVKAYTEGDSDFVSHKDENGKSVKIALPAIDGEFSPPIKTKDGTVTLNSHYGSDGYGTSLSRVDEFVYGNDHKGIDVDGKIGDSVLSMLPGKVKSITYGVSIEVLKSEALQKAGISFDKTSGNFYDKTGTLLKHEEVLKIDPKVNPNSPELKVKGVQYDKKTDTYFVINSSANSDRVILTDQQVNSLNIKPGTEISPNGNSLVISSEIKSGPFAGKYDISYKHLNEAPFTGSNENIVPIAKGTVLAPGQNIGTLGGTGRSTGPHLHIEITTTEMPKDVPREYYDILEKDKNGNGTLYRINPAYFMKEMASKVSTGYDV
ncbi:TIGR04388 family protein [Leptospira bourretii]|uniref:TIGR04388 family protein n=1 Tax=Leptospira bourretii TaxID=2484962 RepID=UPI001090EC83|nr:TIGR04388 family protein [Leptospira bourretii]TGL17390.1 TIGR04388 family protein [Leptospira bourretii]